MSTPNNFEFGCLVVFVFFKNIILPKMISNIKCLDNAAKEITNYKTEIFREEFLLPLFFLDSKVHATNAHVATIFAFAIIN